MPHLSHIINHLGENRDDYFGAVVPPVVQSSNFAFQRLDDMRQALAQEFDSHIYTRGNNPTVKILRDKMAALEGTEEALVFGSGSSAIAAAVMSQVKQGDHVVCVNAPYAWTKILLTSYLPRFGVSATFVDGTSLEAIEAALQENTTVLYLESPTLTFECQDLRACAQLARSRGITTLIDNSYASPLYQQPHALGIDLVIHSGTKYLNGHSDVLVGVVCGSRQHIEKIFHQEYMMMVLSK
ncbi:MAG: aminotransferase class V-fold PLP-dependent enzyme [Saprospiraceae bacterium]